VTHRITRHYSAELQTAKQTLITSKNSVEFTHSDFPCHLKVNRDKLALISRLWKCRNAERLTITANSFTKIVDYRSTLRISPVVAVRMRKFHPLQEPIRFQDLINSARLRARKKKMFIYVRLNRFLEFNHKITVNYKSRSFEDIMKALPSLNGRNQHRNRANIDSGALKSFGAETDGNVHKEKLSKYSQLR